MMLKGKNGQCDVWGWKGKFSNRQLVREQCVQILNSLIQSSAVKGSIWYKQAFLPKLTDIHLLQAGLFYAEHRQLKLRLSLKRSTTALRSPAEQPDIFLMWLYTDHKIFYNHINHINSVKNEQMNLNIQPVSFYLPKLQRNDPYLPSKTPESLICIHDFWSSFCLSLNPCD